jgi:flagellar assembly factor FliW
MSRMGTAPLNNAGKRMSAETVPTIEFVSPMPGFPNHRTFFLLRLEDNGLIYALTSADDPSLRFIVIPPLPFFPDYAPDVDDETLGLLDVHEAHDADRLLVLLVVTPTDTPADATVNLLAPIIVDQVTHRAVQAVLNGTGLPVTAKLAVAA